MGELAMTVAMIVILVPVVVTLIDLPPGHDGYGRRAPNAPPRGNLRPSGVTRWALLRSFGFWTITAPFALALLAQVGFIVHQIALLEPTTGRSLAAFAVTLTTTMALIGRLCLGLIVDRLDPRRVTAASAATQAAALFVIALTPDITSLLLACAVYGFSIGNLITLPPLIIQREFDAAAFGTVLGLSTAIGGIVSALGPGLVGLVHGATGGYATALALCLLLKLVAAVTVLQRPQRPPI